MQARPGAQTLQAGLIGVAPSLGSCQGSIRRKALRLKTLTYTSRASLDLTDEDLAEIHETARHLNALEGVTGLLLFDGARFLQIVEGGEAAIDDLVERLRGDPRHSAFEMRDERFVDRRSFEDWSMELLRVPAGYRTARDEVATILPDGVAAPVRELILRMSGEMAAA